MLTDVVVVGGGIAGLSAARSLATAGLRVEMVEARARLGGRLHTLVEGDVPMELGAEFVHGRPPELLALLEEAKLAYFEIDGRTYQVNNGAISREGDDDEEEFFGHLKHLAPSERDCSFSEAIEATELSSPRRRRLTRYVEGFNAADAKVISAASLGIQQEAEDAIDGEASFKLTHGYKSLVEWLAGECRRAGALIHLEKPLRTLAWKPGEVIAVCDKQEIHAERCVITLPLGVLKAGTVEFQPEPRDFFAALDGVAMGDATRISLLFSEAFWDQAAPNLSFLINAQGSNDLNAWWTPAPASWPMLTGWAGGPRALDFLDAEDLLDRALRSLAQYFDVSETRLRSLLKAHHTHDWHRDQYARGAYSYVASGGLRSLPTLALPVDDTLYFAGEHTEQDGHWGTVHAALRSGLRAADQILHARRRSR